MRKVSILIASAAAALTLSLNAVAAGGGDYVLDEPNLNMSDKAALQRGAALFVNYCLSCHSAEYSRYNRVAEDLEIPLWQLKENLMFTTEKEGDLMKTTMSAEDAKEWFGVAPPDLSLVARVRKPNWIYTYMRAFYQDEQSPSGWNNSLFSNVAMPHVMYEMQGIQKYIGKVDDLDGVQAGQKVVGDAVFELVHPGKMSPAEFDVAMNDLTSFLTYLAEPAQLQRKTIGVYTLVFLLILTMLCYVLKKEYWRDVH